MLVSGNTFFCGWDSESGTCRDGFTSTAYEIEAMLEDAIDNAEEDIDTRLLIECRVEGEQILHHISFELHAFLPLPVGMVHLRVFSG